mgnify:CR=1 FL=1
MSVMLKRSSKLKAIPQECEYGCCTTVYGRNVPRIRRQVRSSEKSSLQAEVRSGLSEYFEEVDSKE